MNTQSAEAAARHDVSTVVDTLQRYRQVFLHAGSLFRPDDVRESLIQSLRGQGLGVSVLDVSQGLPADIGEGQSCFLLTGFAEMCAAQGSAEKLANARAWVQRRLDADPQARVLVLSSVPKLRLLEGVGSHLVTDGQTCFLGRLGNGEVASACARRGVGAEYERLLAPAACGLAGLVDPLLNPPLDIEKRKSAIRDAESRVTPILRSAVAELGWEIATFLDSLLFGQSSSTVSRHENPLVLEALRGAGLIADSATDETQILVRSLGGSLRDAVREVCDSLVAPPDVVAEIAAGLWEIERAVRRAVQCCAVLQHSQNWRAAAIPQLLQEDVVRKYSEETATAIETVRDVPNPLEWLTWVQLLTVINDFEWCRPGDLPASFWRKLRDDVSPIRNRLAHFRLPRLDDADTVYKWRSLLRGGIGGLLQDFVCTPPPVASS